MADLESEKQRALASYAAQKENVSRLKEEYEAEVAQYKKQAAEKKVLSAVHCGAGQEKQAGVKIF
jgi:hypothetical protein